MPLVIIRCLSVHDDLHENQTKKAINNKGIQEAMVEMLRHNLEIYFIETPLRRENRHRCYQQALPRTPRKTRLSKGKPRPKWISPGVWRSFVDCRSKDIPSVRFFYRGGDSARCDQAGARPELSYVMPIRGKIPELCLKADYGQDFQSEIITDLIKVLGCGVQVKSKANKSIASFDINALR